MCREFTASVTSSGFDPLKVWIVCGQSEDVVERVGLTEMGDMKQFSEPAGAAVAAGLSVLKVSWRSPEMFPGSGGNSRHPTPSLLKTSEGRNPGNLDQMCEPPQLTEDSTHIKVLREGDWTCSPLIWWAHQLKWWRGAQLSNTWTDGASDERRKVFTSCCLHAEPPYVMTWMTESLHHPVSLQWQLEVLSHYMSTFYRQHSPTTSSTLCRWLGHGRGKIQV